MPKVSLVTLGGKQHSAALFIPFDSSHVSAFKVYSF